MPLSTSERRLSAFPALVLNADFRPVSTLPLSVMTWQDAVQNTLSGAVTVVISHDAEVHAPSLTVRLPAVIALKRFVTRPQAPALNRHNLLTLRDKCACAYCGGTFPHAQLTIDHVIPRAKGGSHRWENLVGSCAACNQRKADRTPEQARMKLLWRPWRPSIDELARSDFFLQQRRLHESWKVFLPFAA